MDLSYESTRQKEAPETKLGVQATDKALSAGAGDGVPGSLRKMQVQTSVSVLLLQLQSSSSFFCNKLRLLLVCLFVCLFSFCSLVPRCYQFFFIIYF
jgi:hypothetical protein